MAANPVSSIVSNILSKLGGKSNIKVVKTLGDYWVLSRLPFEIINAEYVDNPPFADIAGLRKVVLELINELYNRGRIRVLIVGEPGSGKTTVAKFIYRNLKSLVDSKVIYVSGRETLNIVELLRKIYDAIGIEFEPYDPNIEKLLCNVIIELLHRYRCVVIVIDNVDYILSRDYINVVKLLKILTYITYEYNNFSVILTMNYISYVKYSNDIEISKLLVDYRVIDLREYYPRSSDDVARIIYVHLLTARPIELNHEGYRILKRNPLHPFTKDAIDIIFNILGPRAPREYIIYLRDIVRRAAESRATEINSSFILSYFKVTPSELRVFKHGLTQGMFTGSFLGIGAFMITYGILAHRFEVAAYGAMLLMFGLLTYVKTLNRSAKLD